MLALPQSVTRLWPYAVVFVAGWLASWWFTRPDEDWRVWKRAAEQHLAAGAVYVALIDSLQQVKDSALAVADSAQQRAQVERVRADRERADRLQHQARADQLEAAIANATTPADSLTACMAALGARGAEASACQRETERLRASLAQQDTALTAEKRALVLEEERHALTRARLWKADSLLQSVPNPSRCPLPLCATLGASVEPWDRTLYAEISIPLGKLFRAGVSRRLGSVGND